MTLTAKRPSGKKHPNRRKVQKIVDGSGEMRRLNVPVDVNTYRLIKMRAAMDGKSISQITRELWIEYIDNS